MTERGPEEQRLLDRLKDCTSFHASWGPKAHELTREERAGVINDALDRIAAGDCEVVDFGDANHPLKSKRPQVDVRELVANLGKDTQ
ncbi:hypothetical protein ACN6KF_001479 [Labrys sp. La1]|uniref:hypothetical protein n=1 Tax=Labrys sp. La1 TaxID=3404917 RepID=UPI003EC082F7